MQMDRCVDMHNFSKDIFIYGYVYRKAKNIMTVKSLERKWSFKLQLWQVKHLTAITGKMIHTHTHTSQFATVSSHSE